MLKKSDWKHIKKTNWYRQGGAIWLFYVFGPYHSIHETVGYDGCILHQKGDVNTAFFDRDKEDQMALKFIISSKKDKHKVDRWISDWQKRVDKLYEFLDKNFSQSVEFWSDKKLVNFLHRFDSLALNHWKKGVLCEWTDPSGYNLMKTEILKYCSNLTDEEINLLTAPERPTFIQQELLDRVKIIKKKKRGLNIYRDLEKHTQKYFWFKNNWAYVHNLTVEDFVKDVDDSIKDWDNTKERAEDVIVYLKNIKTRKKALIKKKFIPKEAQNIFYLFTRITDWRDERKKMATCIPNSYLYKILHRLARENNITEEQAGQLIFFEVNGWKLFKKIINNSNRRVSEWVYYCRKNGDCQSFYGSVAKEIFNTLVKTLDKGVLHGMVANKGAVVGRVRIVETKNDFNKMKKGDILVATMTRPEYVPIMRLAGGIVTNEGGVTCHAAIVSRELNTPCIIGTQIATEALKDGDMVEVDANNGVVKIIK